MPTQSLYVFEKSWTGVTRRERADAAKAGREPQKTTLDYVQLELGSDRRKNLRFYSEGAGDLVMALLDKAIKEPAKAKALRETLAAKLAKLDNRGATETAPNRPENAEAF